MWDTEHRLLRNKHNLSTTQGKLRRPNCNWAESKQHFDFHTSSTMSHMAHLPSWGKHSLVCSAQKGRTNNSQGKEISFVLCFQAEGFGQFPQKGLDFLNTLWSLFVTCCLGGITASVPKILRMLSWNFNSLNSKMEYFWHHLLGQTASFYRKSSSSVLLAPNFSLISNWSPDIYTQQVPFHIRNYPFSISSLASDWRLCCRNIPKQSKPDFKAKF